MEARVNHFVKERQQVIQKLALESKRSGGVPDTELATGLFARLSTLLTWLQSEIHMTPDFRRLTKVDAGLQVIYARPEFHFPDEFRATAKALCEKWEAENWGAPPPTTVTEADQPVAHTPGQPADPNQATTQAIFGRGRIHYPPSDHPIWGERGIMHGLAIKRADNRDSQILDDRFAKRDSKVFGHNRIEVGAWFPRRLVALFRGAHGSSQAGICGDAHTGAYSIVVSGFYDDLDQDHGADLYYSGSNSHDNTDPSRPAPASTGTLALHRSLETQTPVRVLRTSTGKSRWAPSQGLRYDGLYRLVAVRQPRNAAGGRYEQFQLERLPGQEGLEQLLHRPTQGELDDYDRISQPYRAIKVRDA